MLISQLQKVAAPGRTKRRREPRLIAGLIPVADGPMADEMASALSERADLMDTRAFALAEQAVEANAPWLTRLGTPPRDASTPPVAP